MITFLIVIASIAGYGFGAGATYAGLRAAGFNSPDESPGTFFGTLLWPLILPGLVGAAVMRRLTAPKRASLPKARMLELGDDER